MEPSQVRELKAQTRNELVEEALENCAQRMEAGVPWDLACAETEQDLTADIDPLEARLYDSARDEFSNLVP